MYQLVVEARRGDLLLGRAEAAGVHITGEVQSLSLDVFEICMDLSVAVSLPLALEGADVSVYALHRHASGIRAILSADGRYLLRGMYPGGEWRVMAITRDAGGSLYGAEIGFTPMEDTPAASASIAIGENEVPSYVVFVPSGEQDVQALIDGWAQATGQGQPLELRFQEGTVSVPRGFWLPAAATVSGGWMAENTPGEGKTTLVLPGSTVQADPWQRKLHVENATAVLIRDLVVDAAGNPWALQFDNAGVQLEGVGLVNPGYPDWSWATQPYLASHGRYALAANSSDVRLQSCDLAGAVDATGDPLSGWTLNIIDSVVSGGRNSFFGVRLLAQGSSFTFQPEAGWDSEEHAWWSTVIGGDPVTVLLDDCEVTIQASSDSALAGAHLVALSVGLRDLPGSSFVMRNSRISVGYATTADAGCAAVEVRLAPGAVIELTDNEITLAAAPRQLEATGRPRTPQLVFLHDKGSGLVSSSDIEINVTGNVFSFLAEVEAGYLLGYQFGVSTWWPGTSGPLHLDKLEGNLFRAPYAGNNPDGSAGPVPYPRPVNYGSKNGGYTIGWNADNVNNPAMLYGDAQAPVPAIPNILE
jgi:hypothetical protein